MIGVVIPAHNEAELIGACLNAVAAAAAHPRLAGETVQTIVILDHCTDTTASIVARHDVATLSIQSCNVGEARACGARFLLDLGARWLSFTDADTLVSPQWLVEQLALNADAVCGSIGVEDWSTHGEHADWLRGHFLATYNDADGHQHIHGANLGVSAQAYQNAGGFLPLKRNEDVELVAALQASCAHIAWSAAPRVTTSSRRYGRARGGFGDALLQLWVERTTLVRPSAPLAG